MDAIANYQRVCEQAAKAGGAVLREWVGRFAVREKGPKDLVTEADLASQRTIRQLLLGAFPDHAFLAEEDSPKLDASDPRPGHEMPAHEIPAHQRLRWIVDPLDGTTNYVHGLPNYSVSVALERGGELLVGAVYDPAADHCFSAAAGRGATCNGRPLQASAVKQLDKAMVAVSFSAQVERGDAEIDDFIEVLLRAQAMRRMGSAALNLCYVAAGWFDGYWSTTTKAWDVAAGVLLVREAGGLVSAIDGTAFTLERPQFIAAATPELHRELCELLSRPRGNS